MKPLFSIIIPLYNKEEHIANTLDSVMEQTFQDFEVLVVNDGSTDKSLEIVKGFAHPKIKIFTIENSGVSEARNMGVSKAEGSLIAFLDADDLWLPSHLEDLKRLYQEFPNCGLYAKAYDKQYFNKTCIQGKYNNLPLDFRGLVKDYFTSSLIDSIAWTSAVAIPKDIFDKHGVFRTDIKSGQDTEMWIRLALKESVAFDSKISARRIITKADHLSTSTHRKDRVKIIEEYCQFESVNKSLKKYLDLIRFSIALERKLAKDDTSFKHLVQSIDFKNLSAKQKLLLKLPNWGVKALKGFQLYLLKYAIYLSPFR